MKDHKAIVIANDQVEDSLYIMQLSAQELSNSILGGNFVHMEMPGLDAHILRRPFSIYSADAEEGTVDILYQVVGSATAYMTTWKRGFETKMIGPIGNHWAPPKDARRALLVGGGVGAAPLFMLCESLLADGVKVDVVLGAASKSKLVCLDRYSSLAGIEPMCATDDGTFGTPGFCTSLAEQAIEDAASNGDQYDYMAVCGPEPLMRIASSYGLDAGILTEASLEKRMACGIGACLSCVVDTKDGKARVCADGPIFNAGDLTW